MTTAKRIAILALVAGAGVAAGLVAQPGTRQSVGQGLRVEVAGEQGLRQSVGQGLRVEVAGQPGAQAGAQPGATVIGAGQPAAGPRVGGSPQPGGTSLGEVARPYHNGSVWDVAYIRVKPGMDAAYMSYLAGPWKAEHEALKKEGLILSYKVIASEPHGASDFNLMLMTEYKDLATMEASEPKIDALTQKLIGSDQQQMQGYKERLEIREVLGSRLSREIVLEARK